MTQLKLPTIMKQVTPDLPQVTNNYTFTTEQVSSNPLAFVDELKVENLEDNTLPSSFSYHNFTKQEPSIIEDYVYNYEFLNYENLTRTINERAIPSYNLFNYRDYIGLETNIAKKIYFYDESIDLSDNLKVNFDIPSSVPKFGYHLFDSSDQTKGTERKNYHDNYFNFWTKFLLDQDLGIGRNAAWTNKQKNLFSFYNPEIKHDYLPNFVSCKVFLPESSFENPVEDKSLMKFLFLHIKRKAPQIVQFNEYDVNNPDLGNQTRELKTWNVIDWLKEDSVSYLEEFSDELILLSKDDKKNRFYRDYLERRLRKVIALARIREIAKNLTPTLKDVLVDKVNCKTYVIGYKIQKRRKDTNKTLIQTFYSDQKSFEFIDNQLRYDEAYSYEVSELRMVLGSSFASNIDGSDLDLTTFKATRNPSIQIVETPFKMFDFKITTPPINAPMVEISNLKYKKNFVRFMLREDLVNTGDYTEFELQEILPVDSVRKQELTEAKFIKDDMTRYYGRATSGNFEVFKIDFKPKKYSDFNEGYLGLLQRTPEPENDLNPVAFYEDLIEHEKKYYYLFRSIDHHLNGGRQSVVCEVMLLQDADEVILRQKMYHLRPLALPYQTNFNFRKFIQIEPELNQVQFKENISLLDLETELPGAELGLGKIFLGSDEFDSIWSYNGDHRYIKLRVEGSESGKKLDLNLRFKIKRKI